MKNKELELLSQSIYEQNVEAGWWDGHIKGKQPKRFETCIALIHSELSEALEGVRKDLMDDHLPHYKMAFVEMADTVIRLLDLHAACGFGFNLAEVGPAPKCWQEQPDEIARMHFKVSEYFNSLSFFFSGIGNAHRVDRSALDLIRNVESFCETYEYGDLWKVVSEKRKYNRTRADHQLENRMKEGGKKF